MTSIDPREKRIALSMWGVAVSMVEYQDPAARDVSRAALERPCAQTIFALLEAGNGKPWQQPVRDAIFQVGIAAAPCILGGPDDV
jgi:hypothetical protein